MTTEFLSTSVIEVSKHLSTRLGNVLRNENFQTMFAALRKSEVELNRTPMLGRKGLEEFKEYVGMYGYKLGDTANFFDLKCEKLMYQTGTSISYASGSKRMVPDLREKEIVEQAQTNAQQVYAGDYLNLIREFTSIREQTQTYDRITDKDIEWVSSLLPDELKDGLAIVFENSAQFRSAIVLIKQDISIQARKAVCDFGHGKT